MAVSEKRKRTGIFNENLKKYFGAEEGAFSILTGPEIEKKTINVKKAMRDLLIQFLGEDNIPRITDEDDQTVRFEICSNGEINTGEYCAVPCKFSKPGKNELTMYLNSRWIHTELEPGDCWYIWIRNQASLPVLGVIKAEKWKKVSGATGYEIQYGTKKNFNKAKTKTIKKAKTVKATIKKLKSGKKYYFRIRTYKTANGQKYYSAWSKAKKVKIK